MTTPVFSCSKRWSYQTKVIQQHRSIQLAILAKSESSRRYFAMRDCEGHNTVFTVSGDTVRCVTVKITILCLLYQAIRCDAWLNITILCLLYQAIRRDAWLWRSQYCVYCIRRYGAMRDCEGHNTVFIVSGDTLRCVTVKVTILCLLYQAILCDAWLNITILCLLYQAIWCDAWLWRSQYCVCCIRRYDAMRACKSIYGKTTTTGSFRPCVAIRVWKTCTPHP